MLIRDAPDGNFWYPAGTRYCTAIQFIVHSPNFLSLCCDNVLYANNSMLLCMHIMTNHHTHTHTLIELKDLCACTVCLMLKYRESLKDYKTTRNK